MFQFISLNNATTTTANIEFSLDVTTKAKVAVTIPVRNHGGNYSVNGVESTKEEAVAAIAKHTPSEEWMVSSSVHFPSESMGTRMAEFDASTVKNNDLIVSVETSINAFLIEVARA